MLKNSNAVDVGIQMDVVFWVKEFVSRSPKLYGAIQHFLKGNSTLVVTDDTNLCLEGYPRSANSFALNLVRGALIEHFPLFFATHSKHFVVNHTHRIATVEAARRRQLPTFVLLREPGEAIPSAVVKRARTSNRDKSTVLRRQLRRYEEFYSYVEGHDPIDVVRFETVVDAPAPFLEAVLEALDLEPPENLEVAGIEEFATRAIDYWSAQQDDIDALTSKFSNEEKEAQKADVRTHMNDEFRASYERIQSLYKRLYEGATV
jgi:hypothetical protein